MNLEPRRTAGYAIATSFNLKWLVQSLKERAIFTNGEFKQFREVIQFLPSGDENLKNPVYIFPYGTLVFWGWSVKDENEFINEVRPFGEKLYKAGDSDIFQFIVNNELKIRTETISLPNDEELTKLACSHALAQSVKLGVFEEMLHQRFVDTESLPQELATRGKITLSRKEIRKKMGEIHIVRNDINFHFDLLDTPEFFWEYDDLEPIYQKVKHYLDLSHRVEVVNKRLGLLYEVFNILANESDNQNVTRLEWIIVILILLEVILYVSKEVFQLF